MRILAAMLLLGTSLCAADLDPLIAKFWPEAQTVQDVADQAETDLLTWLKACADKNQFPRTHFDSGVLYEVRDASAKRKKAELTLRGLQRDVDDAGNARYTAVGDDLSKPLSQWPSRYALITFAPENHTDQQAVAFAIWLYLRKSPDKKEQLCGNRALTVVHQRNTELRPLIEAWVLQHDFEGKGTLKVGDIWDDEFRKERRVLITDDAEEKLVKARNTAAQAEFGRINGEYSRERTVTLQQLLTALDAWERDFAATEEFAKRRTDAGKLRTALTKAIADANDLASEGKTAGDEAKEFEGKARKDLARPKWKEAAELFERALAIDSASMLLLTQTANAWLKAADPEYFPTEDRWGCTHEDRIKKHAIGWWDKLAALKPDDTATLLNQGLCYQLTGQVGRANEIYNRIVTLDPTGTNAAEAKRRMQQMKKK
ncbi:MAG: hypothetical protein IPK87_04065 [Planctomycetes bacterium]|nr:hypothetical protein [Planctomycetota bacterium]